MEMKAEINNENKAKFFALYWGQNLIDCDKYANPVELKSILVNMPSTWFESIINKSKILLKPLSEISDEDIIKLYKLITPEDNGWIVSRSLEYRRDWLKRLKYQQNLNSDIVDFIRSIGAAYKWMGLSVEEMVEAGWIKLIE